MKVLISLMVTSFTLLALQGCKSTADSTAASVEIVDPDAKVDPKARIYFVTLEKDTPKEVICALMTDGPLEDPLKFDGKENVKEAAGTFYSDLTKLMQEELESGGLKKADFDEMQRILNLIRADELHKEKRNDAETNEEFRVRFRPYIALVRAIVRLRPSSEYANTRCPSGWGPWAQYREKMKQSNSRGTR